MGQANRLARAMQILSSLSSDGLAQEQKGFLEWIHGRMAAEGRSGKKEGEAEKTVVTDDADDHDAGAGGSEGGPPPEDDCRGENVAEEGENGRKLSFARYLLVDKSFSDDTSFQCKLKTGLLRGEQPLLFL